MENTQIGKRDNLYLPFDALAAPNCNQASELWFEKTESDICSYFDFYTAFLCKIINKQIFPVNSEWVSFAVAGSVVSVLSDRLIIPRKDKIFYNSLEPHIWEALYYSSQENNDKLNNELLGFILRLFLPREYGNKDNNGLYKISDFCRIWLVFWTGADYYRIENRVQISSIMYYNGHRIFEKLPQDFKNGIEKIAERAPTMLKIVLEHIRKNGLITRS